MSDSERDEKIDKLLELLIEAPALNGGFAKLSDAVKNIKDTNTKVLYELQLVKTNQNVHTKKIEDMHESLYDPDNGLFSRVTAAIKDNKAQEAGIEFIKQKTEHLETAHTDFAKKIALLEEKHDAIERIAGKDLQELHSTISIRKNMLRAFWIFITGTIAGLAKFLWDIFPVLF